MGPTRPGRRGGIPGLLPRLPRPDHAGPLRGDPAGGLPRLRPGQLHLGRRARWLGVDDLQRVAVGPQLVQPGGPGRVRLDHPRPRQPRRRRLPARRHRLHVEAARHRLPGPAGGPRDHPGAACRHPDRVPGGGLQGRGDRRADEAARLSRLRPLHRQGERPRLPQQPHGAGVVDAGGPGRPARRPRARAPSGEAAVGDVGDLPALPRRHRLGHRRRRRPGRRRLRGRVTAASSRTGMRATSPALPPVGSSSSTTR